MSNQDKILLLYSGGLDSRLAAQLLKEKSYDITAILFRLPFASDKAVYDEFLDKLEIPLKILDSTKGKLLEKYLSILKKPRYGRGVGYNPCTDCKLFMTNHLTDYARENNFAALATGEVPGQRPMSQTSGKMKIIKENTEIPIIRPLQEIGIEGRSRNKQIELAVKYSINYPSPGGGCLLCEKALKTRFATLIENNLITEKTLSLSKTGRHFFYPDKMQWFVVGRNKEENDIIEEFKNVFPSGKGKPAVFYYTTKTSEEETRILALEIQQAYEAKYQQKIKALEERKI